MNQPVFLLVGAMLLLTVTFRPTAAEVDPEQSCVPGTIGSIKSNLMRTLIICYVYGCPEEVTTSIAANFNQFHNADLYPNNDTTAAAATAPKTPVQEVPLKILSKLAKLTSAMEKDRTAALTACTDYVSLLNKLVVDVLQIKSKCYLEPQGNL